MKVEEKRRAIILRKNGESIKQIARVLGVSKGSVSLWVRNIQLSDDIKRNLFLRGWTNEAVEKRRLSRLSNERKKKQDLIDHAGKDINHVSTYELKIIGATLYWAEGRKRGKNNVVGFSNSDPTIIQIMMKFFKEVCNVPKEKFRGHIHIHSHLNIKEAEKYWSAISLIPLKQFYKTYSKPSISSKGKMDSLPYGTFDIYVCDVKIFLKIMGWIKKISKLNNGQ